MEEGSDEQEISRRLNTKLMNPSIQTGGKFHSTIFILKGSTAAALSGLDSGLRASRVSSPGGIILLFS